MNETEKNLAPETALIVRLLAETNILHAPFRHDGKNDSAASAVHQRIREYRRSGLPLIGGGTDTQRHEHVKHVQVLRNAGLIKTAGRTRAATARLTRRGYDIASKLVACYSLSRAWVLLELVAELGPRGVSEFDIAAGSTKHDQVQGRNLAQLEHVALPLIEAELLCAASCSKQHVRYGVTGAGLEALEAGPPDPTSDLPEYDPAAAELYDAIWQPGLDARETWKPANPSDIVIRLPVGAWELHADTRRAARLRRQYQEIRLG